MIMIPEQYVFFLTAPVNKDPNLQKEYCIYLHLEQMSQNGWAVLNS